MRVSLKTALLALLAAAIVCCGCGCGAGDEEDTVATTTTAATTVTTTTTLHGVLDTGGLRVRSGPGLDHDEIGGLEYGEDVVILDRVGDWYMIAFDDGVGYINAHYVDMDDAPNASEMAEDLPTAAPTTTVTTATGGTAATTTVPGTTQADTPMTIPAGIPDTRATDAY